MMPIRKNICSFLLGIVFICTNCVSSTELEKDQPFSWDMSVENHSGISKNLYEQDGMHRGMSIFLRRANTDEAINQLMKNNIEWVALVPFLDQENERSLVNDTHEEIGKWTRRDSSFIKRIEGVHKRGMHVMLKPHLWLRDGWRSNVHWETEAEWDTWFQSYRKHMIHYAILAEKYKVELYCIGAEFKTSINAQPHLWNALVDDIKKEYTGKLTYAANWDGEFEDVTFWHKMDYIGIQAYFPLTENARPDLEEIKTGWDRHIKMLEKLSQKYSKPILFTEIGYRSDESATIKPWEWNDYSDESTAVKSDVTQQRAYEAMFQKLWFQKWFAGVYFWQWHHHTNRERTILNKDFTPRFKPAENTMAKWYGRRVKE